MPEEKKQRLKQHQKNYCEAEMSLHNNQWNTFDSECCDLC